MMLDWKTRSLAGVSQERITGDLESWLNFCAAELASAYPQNTRLVGYLVVESPMDRYPELEAVFRKLKKAFKTRTPQFHLEVLNPLHQVDEDHMENYLLEVDCPEALQDTLPALILAHTGGDFEKTVRLLDEQQFRMGWNRLAQWLGEQQGQGADIAAPPPHDDEDDQAL